MKAHYVKLLEYNSWANRLFLTSLLENTVMNNKIFLLFSHILTAEEVWLCRAKGEAPPLQRLWEVYSNETLQQLVQENSTRWIDYLAASDMYDLSAEVSYKNSKGEAYTSRLDDIITHMVNHGTHHRAQIASMLQQEKIVPPASDYILFLRKQRTAMA